MPTTIEQSESIQVSESANNHQIQLSASPNDNPLKTLNKKFRKHKQKEVTEYRRLKDIEVEELQLKDLKIATKLVPKIYRGRFCEDGITSRLIHPLSVSEKLDTPVEKTVGLLHEVFEENLIGDEMLVELGIMRETVCLIKIFTKRIDETYLDYLTRIQMCPTVVRVKLEDLRDDLSKNGISRHSRDNLELSYYILSNPKAFAEQKFKFCQDKNRYQGPNHANKASDCEE